MKKLYSPIQCVSENITKIWKNTFLNRYIITGSILCLLSTFSANAQNGDLAIIKSGPYQTNPGATIEYVLMVTNNGPDDMADVIVRMPATANFTAQSITCLSGLANNGSSVCPSVGDLTIANLEGAGLIIPSIPDGGAVTLKITGLVSNVANYSEIVSTATVAANAVGSPDITIINNSNSFKTIIHDMADGELSIYSPTPPTIPLAASPNGGTFNLEFVLTSGSPIPSLGNQFTIPVTYSQLFNRTGNDVNYIWNEYGPYKDTAVSTEIFSLVPKGDSLFKNLPTRNTGTFPLSFGDDQGIRELLANNDIDPLGYFNITLGDIPAVTPTTSFVSDVYNIIWGAYILNMSADDLLISTFLTPLAQVNAQSSYPNNIVLDVPLGNTYPYRYTATLKSGTSAPADFLSGEFYWANMLSAITFFTPTNVLPVHLKDFTVHAINNSALLKWNSLLEQNNKGFEIFRSSDGYVWTKIGFVGSKAANGNSSMELNYQFIDHHPSNGQNFYKISQIDADGKLTYSDTKSIIFSKPLPPSIIANPVQHLLKINRLPVGGELRVYNQSGQLVLPAKKLVNVIDEIDVKLLRNGMYYIDIIDAKGKLDRLKMIKQ